MAGFGLLLASAALPGAARADLPPLTPEQRHSLDDAMALWGMGLFGGEHSASYTVGVEGDHYRLEAPLDRPIGHGGARIEGDKLVASAMPLDAGRWALDNVRQPASIRFVPPPKPDGTAEPGLSLAQQSRARTSHIVIDPSLATVSSFDSTAEGLVVGMALPTMSLDFKADRATSHAAWQPAAAGRVDVDSARAIDGIAYRAPGLKPGTETLRVTARHLSAETHATGFSPRRMAEAVRAGLQLLDTAPVDQLAMPKAIAPDAGAPAKPPRMALPKPDPAQRALLHSLLDAMRDAYGGLSQSIAMEGVDVAAGGHHVTLDKLAVDQSFAAPGGKSDARMRFVTDGIASPDIPPGTLRELLPHRVVLAPHFAGLAVADAFSLLSRAIDSGDANIGDLEPDALAAMARAPVNFGLDELSFDLGPAKFTASGSVRSSGPQDVTGGADIKVTGLDTLIRLASADPLLGQGAPVLLLLKGIGQQDGDVVTWKLAFADRKLTVNGTDFSQLIPRGR